MENIGVIGAGVMGQGVAQNLAECGFNIILVDVLEEILNNAKTEIERNIKFQNMFKKDKLHEPIERLVARISFTLDFQSLKDVDCIIENVTENIEIKESLYRRIGGICKDDCLYLVNTSCIPITRIGSVTKRPSMVIGTHFMNPVSMMKAVEVIRGFHTSEETILKTKDLLSKMGKESIIVNDMPGFVSNRISHLMMNEAAFIVQDQVATPEDVDEIFKQCYGHKMGPLETADLIGLDTVVNSLEVLYQSFQDSKFRCCPLLKKMVEAGLHGRKSGRGFYTY